MYGSESNHCHTELILWQRKLASENLLEFILKQSCNYEILNNYVIKVLKLYVPNFELQIKRISDVKSIKSKYVLGV